MTHDRKHLPDRSRRIGGVWFTWVCDIEQADPWVRERVAHLIKQQGWQGGGEGGHGKLGVEVLSGQASEAVRILSADPVLRGSRIVWNPDLRSDK